MGCNTRHLKYSANDVTKIELYDLTNENQQLEKEITNQIEIKETLEEIEKEVILNTLKKYDNNQTEAAKRLGITLRQIGYKIKNYKLTL